jgi:hypothetical protein
MSHQQQQQQQQQPAAFVNKPARGWLHPDHLIAKVGASSVANPGFFLSQYKLFPSLIRIFFKSSIRIKEFEYFNPKIVFKLSEICSGLFIPDPDRDFFTGSGFATLVVLW